MERYTFMNKFVFTNKKVVIGILIKLILVVVSIIAVIKYFIEGFSPITVVIPVFIISLLIPKGSPSYTEEVSTKVSYENEEIKIYYQDLDRHDKLGLRNEEYFISPYYIKQISYNKKYHKLSIVSQALVRITSSTNEIIEHDYRKEGGFCENVLYLTDEIREPLLSLIKRVCEYNKFIEESS